MTTSTRAPSTYSHPNSWEHAGYRLQCLERVYDPGTIRRLEALRVGPGQRCLEVGAGAGSITRWLCERAGLTGRVLAVDLDPSLIADLRAPNLEVAGLDLRCDALPQEAFDLAHVRAVLTHVPERDAVLDVLVASLAPGGWLLVEEGDSPATLGRCEGLHARGMGALVACLAEAGADLSWACDLPARLTARGLTDVGAECELPLVRGGSAGPELLILTIRQLRERFLATGVTDAELDEWVAALADPDRWFPGIALTAAWGRRP